MASAKRHASSRTLGNVLFIAETHKRVQIKYCSPTVIWFNLFHISVTGKDARLYVYRLSTLKRGIEERQLVRTKCDSRENKLEKTKGRKNINLGL